MGLIVLTEVVLLSLIQSNDMGIMLSKSSGSNIRSFRILISNLLLQVHFLVYKTEINHLGFDCFLHSDVMGISEITEMKVSWKPTFFTD